MMSIAAFRIPFVGVICSFLAGPAVAATLTFDTPTGGEVASYTEAGMTITPTAASTSAVFISGGSWKVPCCPDPQFDQYELTTGGVFNMESLEIISSDAGDPIVFEGFLGTALIATVTVDADNFGPLVFSGFDGIDRLRVTVSGAFTDPRIDDITFTEVPLPGAIGLFLAGLAALRWRTRRRVAAVAA